jgi:hypothetical protein
MKTHWKTAWGTPSKGFSKTPLRTPLKTAVSDSCAQPTPTREGLQAGPAGEGIAPDPEVPGFKGFVLRHGIVPRQPAGRVKAHHESLAGTIRSRWTIDGGKFRFEASVPPNTTATACLPVKDFKSSTEGGRPLAASEGVQHSRDEGGCAVLRLQPGEYSFDSDFGSGF